MERVAKIRSLSLEPVVALVEEHPTHRSTEGTCRSTAPFGLDAVCPSPLTRLSAWRSHTVIVTAA
eukprot:359396-Amphidinium_carterae.1